MVAKMYQNDHERAEKMGLTMSGIATGVLIGYPMGGILFDLVGEAFPFAIITLGTALILGKLRRVDFEEVHRIVLSENILSCICIYSSQYTYIQGQAAKSSPP